MINAETNRDVTARLAGFASDLSADTIPPETSERTKLLLLDALASAMTGWTSPETAKVSSAVSAATGDGDSTVFGGGTASIGGATMLNGYLTTARSICDMHQPTLCHVTPVVVPPVLALAERDDADGATLLSALCAGFETNVRIGVGLDYAEFRSRGWHTPGVAGPVAGALGAARVVGLGATRAERAMGVAFSQAGGTFASFGTPTIKFHQARAAWASVISVLFEEQGFEGPMSVLTAQDGGMYWTFTNGGRPELAIDGLGRDWKLLEIAVRLWPAAVALQSILTIVDEDQMPDPSDIESVTVSLPPANYEMNADIGWETTFEATLSARYVTAVALMNSRYWLDQLELGSLRDRRVDAFARDKVHVVRDDSLPEGGASVEVVTSSGSRFSALREYPKGSPRYPATWGDVADKLRRAVSGRISRKHGEQIIDAVGDLERLESSRDLIRLLRRS